MKFLSYFFSGVISLALITACGNGNTSDQTAAAQDTKKDAEQHNDAKFDGKDSKDAQFLVDAADINLAEISLGELAGNNAMSDDTKELGHMMNRDHKKAYDDLVALAAKKSITIPSVMSDASQKDYNSLAEKKGADFDKKFCDMMVDGHKDAISKFEKASKDATDADIQAWASNMLPALRSHLDHAMMCQDKIKKIKS